MAILKYRAFKTTPVLPDTSTAIVYSALMMVLTTRSAEGEEKARCTSKSISVQTCFNKYHESDSYSLTGIVFSSGYTDECALKAPMPNLTMEAPELKDNLDKIQGIYSCLRQELDKCEDIEAFFSLRHLLFTFQKALLWLNCPHNSSDTEWADEFHFTEDAAGEPTKLAEMNSKWTDASFRNRRFFCSEDVNRMDRFADILKAFTCLECFRHSKGSVCNERKFINDQRLLNKIIRLEVLPYEVCPELEQHIACLETNNVVKRCSSAYFMELYKLFAFTWCSSTYSVDFSAGAGSCFIADTKFNFAIFCITCILSLFLFQ